MVEDDVRSSLSQFKTNMVVRLCSRLSGVPNLSKIVDAFCAKKGRNADELKFIYEGSRIGTHFNDPTPEELGMEDGHVSYLSGL